MMPLESILVATDSPQGSARLAARVAHLPLAERAEVRLLHVVATRPEKLRRGALADARAALGVCRDALAKRLHAKVSAEVTTGEPFVEIVRHARRHGAQLVVLGKHTRKGRRWGLGTTAERVVRSGSTPVLVVQREAARPYATPIVAVDLTDVARTIVDVARLVVGGGVPLRLVHSYRVPFEGFMSMSVSREEMESFKDEYRGRALDSLRSLLAEIGEETRGWSTAVRQGDPRLLVIREAVKHDADLVVVGTHGRTGLSHVLLGNVAAWLLHNAPCDVLVARPERFTFELP